MSALDALFERHLVQMTPSLLKDYCRLHRLEGSLFWKDSRGQSWSLGERVVWLACTSDHAVDLRLLNEAPPPWGTEKWDKASAEEKRWRAMTWVAVQRQSLLQRSLRSTDLKSVQQVLAPLLSRSFAKQPPGTPASGFGQIEDKGWLHEVWRVLEIEVFPYSTGAVAPWSGVLAHWVKGSLLAGPGGSIWHWGGVSGTRKHERNLGDPGWEAPDSLPGMPPWFGQGRPLRPAQLEPRWHAIALEWLERLASRMEQESFLDVKRTLGASSTLEETRDPSHWLTQSMAQALLRIASIGLPSVPDRSKPALERYDGLAVSAVEWLIRAKAPDAWFPIEQRQSLAQALVAHQKDWSTSANPMERQMALSEGSLLRSHKPLMAWALAQLEPIEPVPSRIPRLG